jgi:ATP-binding cassette subfamily F protein uup
VRELVAGPTRQPDWTDAALLERLWFGTDTQWAPVRLLSGGERRRLQLALVLRQGPNVLLLDEPTNDLDLDTLRALEDLLDAWPGTLVVVSHDRAFLERTVEDVVVLEHVGAGVEPVRDGGGGGAPRGPMTGPVRVGRLPGGYAAYEASRRAARVSGRVGPVTPRAVAPAAGPSAPAARGERGPSTRSPSTLRHLMRRADADMLRLHERQSALEAELAAAQGDHVALARVGEDLSAVAGELAAVEESWLALAEEAEGQGLTT